MDIVVIYGCPCSGKSTYVESLLNEGDLVYDYDLLVRAMTNTSNHELEKPVVHGVILEIRNMLVKLAKEQEKGTLYILTRWASEYLRNLLAEFKAEYKFIDIPYEKIMDNLRNDESRPDKEGWKKVIDQWFDKYKTSTRSQKMKEIRVTEIRAEIPAGIKSLILCGRPIVYDMPTVIHDPAGEYIEIIQRGALDGADLSDVRLFYNHDLNKVPLARTPRTMQLELTPAGLEMRAALPETTEARAVYEAVKRRDLSGMSFAFTVSNGGSRYDPQTNTRTITKIAKVLECSVVPFPAYPTASVEARNERSAGLKTLTARKQAKRLVNQILKVRI